jgi:tetratricopeptide (TPR) repeat protein
VEYPVLPLGLPEAVELFCARARAEPDEAVHQLCRALDNLPLAIELAAARAGVLSPEQILDRLSGRLDLFKGGRDADPRQQTLRATIEWSYELLTPPERRLFSRLAVFRGGCTLEAAVEVTDADLDTLQSLVDKSLLRHTEERFWMLETIGEYAAERLLEGEEQETIRKRHLDFFLALAERAYEERLASGSRWFLTFDAEHDNFRAALDWARISRPEAEAQLAGAVAYYWHLRGHAAEARERLAGALVRHASHDRIRARALTHLGDIVEELSYLREALGVWRELGDALGEPLALEAIGWARDNAGEYEAAKPAFEQSLALRSQAGGAEFEGWIALAGLCLLLVAQGEIEGAEVKAHELEQLGARYEAPRPRQLGLHFLADCPLVGGDYPQAERRYLRALAYARRSELVHSCPNELLGVAMSAAGQREDARAVRLAAAAYAQQELLGLGNNRWWSTMQEQLIGSARARLGPEQAEAAERVGREASFDAVLDEVLGTETAPAAL